MKLFDDNIIPEYVLWKNENKDNFTWWNYVNMKADIQTALAFSKFFYAELMEVDGNIFLKDNFSLEKYSQWKNFFNNDKTSIEKAMNTYEVEDFFHINTDYSDKNITDQVDALGKMLEFFWKLSFREQLPNREIVIDLYEDQDSLYITVFENRINR